MSGIVSSTETCPSAKTPLGQRTRPSATIQITTLLVTKEELTTTDLLLSLEKTFPCRVEWAGIGEEKIPPKAQLLTPIFPPPGDIEGLFDSTLMMSGPTSFTGSSSPPAPQQQVSTSQQRKCERQAKILKQEEGSQNFQIKIMRTAAELTVTAKNQTNKDRGKLKMSPRLESQNGIYLNAERTHSNYP